MPPDEPAADADETPAAEAPDGPRSGLPDWAWGALLTVAIAAAVIVIGRATFVA
jgi:hypothetical protein